MGIIVTADNATILNGVLWHDNSANTGGAGTITVTNAYTGNPAFAADGYHLTVASAAIDQGLDAGVDIDVDLDLRPIGAGFDLGADEAPLFLIATPAASATLVYTAAQHNPTILDIAANAVSETTTIAFTPLESVPISPGLTSAGHAFDLSAYRDDAGQSLLIRGFAFQETATLTVRYLDADVARIDEPTLALYRYWAEGTLGFWERVGVRPGESQALGEENNVMTAWILGLGRWDGMGSGLEHSIFLPVVLRGD